MKCDIFISYRRTGSSMESEAIYKGLKLRGYLVFRDNNDLGSGRFDTAIERKIRECNDFILIIPPKGLLTCFEEKDWVRREIRSALKYKKKIIPILLGKFVWPEKLPDDINEIRYINGLELPLSDSDHIKILLKKLTRPGFMNSKKRLIKLYVAIAVFLLIISSMLIYNLAVSQKQTEQISENVTNNYVDNRKIKTELKLTIGSTICEINGKQIDIGYAPYIQVSSNSTLIPLKQTAIALMDGIDVSQNIFFDEKSGTETINLGHNDNRRIIQFQDGSNIYTINGVAIPIEYGVVAETYNGNLYVPFRTVASAFDIDVEWDSESRTVTYKIYEQDFSSSKMNFDVTATIGEKDVIINEKSYQMDVSPYISETSGEVMLPLRFISSIVDTLNESADETRNILWDGNSKVTTIFIGHGIEQKIVQFQEGSEYIVINGTAIPLGYNATEITDSRVFLSSKAVALAFDAELNSDNRTVNIKTYQ